MRKLLIILYLLISVGDLGYSQNITFTKDEKEWIKNHPRIEFGYEPNWPPYEIYKDETYTGIVGDYVLKIEEETGINFVPIKNISWAKSLDGLKSGEIHIVPSCAITPERKKFLYFTDPYITDPLIISTRINSPFISGIHDLKGKKVAVPKNYYTIEIISEQYTDIELIEFNTVSECLEALSYEKVDAFIGYLGVVSYYINHKGFTNLKIAAPTPFKENGIGFAVLKNDEWKPLRDIAQKVMNHMSQAEKSQIRNDWISVRYDHKIDFQKFMLWTGIVLFVVMIIITFLTAYNRLLKKQIRLREESEKQLNTLLNEVNKQNHEKEILLQEIHHRVKNNLQIITSLLRLQASSTKSEDVIQSLLLATDRIRAISLIHEKIYQSNQLNNISLKNYVDSLSHEIASNFGKHVDINVVVENSINQASLKNIVPLGLILNELVTNSLKYGFILTINPMIDIKFNQKDQWVNMIYFDNGQWLDNHNSDFFGTSLINIFTEQLDGDYQLDKTEEGTTYTFQFKINN